MKERSSLAKVWGLCKLSDVQKQKRLQPHVICGVCGAQAALARLQSSAELARAFALLSHPATCHTDLYAKTLHCHSQHVSTAHMSNKQQHGKSKVKT